MRDQPRGVWGRGWLRLAVLVVCAAATLATTACRHPDPTASPVALKKKNGPLFLVLIVDTSASVSGYRGNICKYVQAAVEQYGASGPLKVTVINLNEKPSRDFQKDGEFYADDVDELLKYIKTVDLKAKGTDVVGALEKAVEYRGYERVEPRDFKVLCFTDGIIEGPKKYKTYKDFDWGAFKKSGAGIGFYFVDPSVRKELEASVKDLNVVIKEKNDALDDVNQEEPKVP